MTTSKVKSTTRNPYVIARTFTAGVFAGNLVYRKGKEVKLSNARRIWYWAGAASLSQLAMEGTSKPESCKFPCPVNSVILTECIELIETSAKAENSIKRVPVWHE